MATLQQQQQQQQQQQHVDASPSLHNIFVPCVAVALVLVLVLSCYEGRRNRGVLERRSA
ncbi:hypothetical protein BDW02DRAFT_572011 [Decorospora gaudefroyi]|uniref:Uncharacterized protein n=1 Tax=Decorospora gaudefroyi TaxID=184978 RepID=A0A6A5K1F4_9PLEO|nr:hypothetical protein BDW02DRAFT_572011 [Decorospora gaudefroyi]